MEARVGYSTGWAGVQGIKGVEAEFLDLVERNRIWQEISKPMSL
jgi:hypothetical protein